VTRHVRSSYALEAMCVRVKVRWRYTRSRSDVPEYDRMERELAEEVGRINGKFGDVDWTPLRYINKPMSRAALAGLYRMSRVGLVTRQRLPSSILLTCGESPFLNSATPVP
jgi:trehalose 6-phosphate synthase